MEFTLLGAAVAGVGAMYVAIKVLNRDGRLEEEAPKAWDVLLGAAVLGLIVGRAWAMLETGTNPVTNPGDFILVRGGVSTIGATLGALASIIFGYRTELWAALGAITAPILFGLAGWHGGCVVRGACGGTATDLPWGITGSTGISQHPVELYAAFGLALAAGLVARTWKRRSVSPGVLFAIGLGAASLVRLVTEPLRLHFGSGLLWFYGLGVVASALIAALAWRNAKDAAPQEPAQHQ